MRAVAVAFEVAAVLLLLFVCLFKQEEEGGKRRSSPPSPPHLAAPVLCDSLLVASMLVRINFSQNLRPDAALRIVERNESAIVSIGNR